MPSLIVLRHAKAAAGPGLADIDRPLNERGRRDAAATGEWLRNGGLTPDFVLCSTAVRTRQTLAGLALATSAVKYESRVYDNDPDLLLDLVRLTDDGVRRLLLIGHNPSVHMFVGALSGESPESFPTSALAVIDVPGTWADIRTGGGELITYRTPKD
jgi:phosphohistidine phosphatase